MAQKWQQEELTKLAQFTAIDFKSWLIAGLVNWCEGEPFLAFAPLQNSFCAFEDNIAEQLVEMTTNLTPATQAVFIEGLTLAIGSVGEEHELRFCLESILEQVQQPRVIAA